MQDNSAATQVPQAPPSSIPSPAPVSAPAMPQSYQAPADQFSYQTPQPQAPDPWQAAYQRLSAGMSVMPPSPPQAPSWQAAPQVAPSPAYYPSPIASPPAAFNTGIPISAFQQTPTYSPTYLSAPQSVPMPATQPQQDVSDGYLSGVSDESLEVLQHFGAEAPALLNRYACTVEDALLTQAEQSGTVMQQLQQLGANLQQMEAALNGAIADNNAYNLLCTDPDLLADYVNDFFGPNGPAPVELPEDRLRAEVEGRPAPEFQRPELPMPAPSGRGGSGADPEDFWGFFNQVATQRPQDLWKVLDQVQAQNPDLLASKYLVSMEG